MVRRAGSSTPPGGEFAARARAVSSTPVPSFAVTGVVISGVAHVSAFAVLVAHWLLGGTLVRVIPPPRGTVSIDLQAAWASAGSGLEGPQPKPLRIQITPVQAPPDERLTARSMPVSRVGRLPPTSRDQRDGEAPERHSAEAAPEPLERQETDADPETPAADELPAFPRSRRAVRAGLAAVEKTSREAWTPPAASSRRSDGALTEAQPRKVFSPQPNYPPDLLAAGISGQVKLRVEVRATGQVGRVSVYRSSGQAALDRAALEAVRRWRFEPARQAGIPIGMEILVPVRFTITNQ